MTNAAPEHDTNRNDPVFVGIDMAKDSFVWAIHGHDQTYTLDNDTGGFESLLAALREHQVGLVVVEATGGYENPLVRFLVVNELAVSRCNPRAAREFAKSMGHLAKTDRIDAMALAQYAQTLKNKADQHALHFQLPDPMVERLQTFIVRREQLIGMRTAEKNRLSGAGRVMEQSIKTVIKTLDKQIAKLDNDIDQHLNAHFKQQNKQLQNIPGIGPVCSAMMIGFVPELGQANGRRIAKLIGLAPLNQDSGQHRGKRKIKGGRAIVRSTLYMATLSAIQYNPVIRTFYQRLLGAGKTKKVAITACAHKLLRIMNAMARTGQPWNAQNHVITA